MSDAPSNENEAGNLDWKIYNVSSAGEIGVCFLLLSAMLAVPKQEWEFYLTTALVTLTAAIFLSLSALYLFFYEYTGRIVRAISWTGVIFFGITVLLIIFHFNETLGLVWSIICIIVGAVLIISSYVSFVNRAVNTFLRRVRKPRTQTRSVIPLVPLQAAMNGAQRPHHSSIVQREMKYHKPIERSRAGNRTDTYVSKGSHQVPPQA